MGTVCGTPLYSAWSLAQDERKYNRPINANELNSNIGREHLFTACANLTNNRPALSVEERNGTEQFAELFGSSRYVL